MCIEPAAALGNGLLQCISSSLHLFGVVGDADVQDVANAEASRARRRQRLVMRSGDVVSVATKNFLCFHLINPRIATRKGTHVLTSVRAQRISSSRPKARYRPHDFLYQPIPAHAVGTAVGTVEGWSAVFQVAVVGHGVVATVGEVVA